MKRIMFVALMCAFMATPALSSLSWNYSYADGTGTSLTSPVAGAVVDTFDSGVVRADWTYTAGYAIYPGIDVAGKASAPYNPETDLAKDNTGYFAVPLDSSGPLFVDVTFGGGTYSYLGLQWGSMDTYNQIQFYSGATLVGTVTGGAGPAGVSRDSGTGGQTDWENNAYVNISSTQAFDRIRISSFSGFGGASPYAFELDNLAVAVPLPGAVLLGALGLLAAGRKLRKMV